MTKGDILFGKETYYKEIKFRSSLETNWAYILDKLNIEWKYEPKRFRLKNGEVYIPDFYLPELKTWIEVKGRIEEHNKIFSKLFVEENKEPLILISYTELYFFGNDYGEVFEEKELLIGRCSKCNSYWFCSNYGSYHCRKCGNHEGDHDLIHNLSSTYHNNDFGIEKLKEEVEGWTS